jgi:hypothetical protein
MELEVNIRLVQIAVEVVDPSGVEGRRTPLDAMDLISLAQQQFGKIGAVLSGHAGDQCDLAGHGLFATSAIAGAGPQAATAYQIAEIFRRKHEPA